jgi:glycosyltransferase involved in cell wall biosynthesis
MTTPARKKTVAADEDTSSNFAKLIGDLLAEREIDPALATALSAVRSVLAAPDPIERPFLSVLLRTQGKRLEPLKDALLCLSAQTDEDFEVIVLQHDATKENAFAVRAILGRLPPAFAARVRLVAVKGGTRAKPLNAGVREATGQYLAVYDDDDLVFGNWVAEFHAAAAEAGGRLLRALVANQTVVPEVWPQGQSGFRTGSWPKAEYPSAFEQLEHLLVNHSPFMSWAFPRSLFWQYGVRFDEELVVCEDWDIILRGSLICGVDDVDALTSIYRRWELGESSYTSHTTEAWAKSEQRVLNRINDSVLMFPPGSLQQLRAMILHNGALRRFRFLFNGHELRGPLQPIWDMASPVVRNGVRVRNRIRRMRSR